MKNTLTENQRRALDTLRVHGIDVQELAGVRGYASPGDWLYDFCGGRA